MRSKVARRWTHIIRLKYLNLPQHKMSKFVLGKMAPEQSYNVSIGHSNNLSDGKKLKEKIQRGHHNLNSIYLMDIG